MSQEAEDGGQRAFSTFRALNAESDLAERDQLFRNMAVLYSYVSERCDDEQVGQYDDVLCQLAGLVEVEARAFAARLLAPLGRVPGNVAVRLAGDVIEVAAPLLERCSVLSDDDLIDIVANQSEAHRLAIAGREPLAGRVADALAEYGGVRAITRLVSNRAAEIGGAAAARIAGRAGEDAVLAEAMRSRSDIDWRAADAAAPRTAVPGSRGFSDAEWALAYNQVKAMADRRHLDESALVRFARFGYGHHVAAGLCVMMRIPPELFVGWLTGRDHAALTVALRAVDLPPDLFEAVIAAMPWQDTPDAGEKTAARNRYEALTPDEAVALLDLWRMQARRRKPLVRAA